MRFKTICFIKQINALCCNNQSRQFSSLTIQTICKRRQIYTNPIKLTSLICSYSSDNKKHIFEIEKKAEALKDALEQKKLQIQDTEQRIRQKGIEIVRDLKHQKEITGQKFKVKKEHLVKDILETKAKVREKFEEVVEVVNKSVLQLFFNLYHMVNILFYFRKKMCLLYLMYYAWLE